MQLALISAPGKANAGKGLFSGWPSHVTGPVFRGIDCPSANGSMWQRGGPRTTVLNPVKPYAAIARPANGAQKARRDDRHSRTRLAEIVGP